MYPSVAIANRKKVYLLSDGRRKPKWRRKRTPRSKFRRQRETHRERSIVANFPLASPSYVGVSLSLSFFLLRRPFFSKEKNQVEGSVLSPFARSFLTPRSASLSFSLSFFLWFSLLTTSESHQAGGKAINYYHNKLSSSCQDTDPISFMHEMKLRVWCIN